MEIQILNGTRFYKFHAFGTMGKNIADRPQVFSFKLLAATKGKTQKNLLLGN